MTYLGPSTNSHSKAPSTGAPVSRPKDAELKDFCPLCNGAGRRAFRAHGYWIRKCAECSHRWAEIGSAKGHVERVYDDRYFSGGGAGYSDYLGQRKMHRAHGRWYGKLLNHYMNPGTVLDVGAAAGFILEGFVDFGWTGQGIEVNPNIAQYARNNTKVSVSTGAFEHWRSTRRFDVVSMIQVLPHFVDPVVALQRASEYTKAGGFWIIETWNRDSWTARILGRRWHEYSPPSVLHWFTPSSVQRLAGRFGFVEIGRGRPTKRLSGAHLKSLMKFKLGSGSSAKLSERLLSISPDRVSIPYPSEDLFWMLLQDRSSCP